MNIPKELFYTEDHEWVKKNGDELQIGISQYAADELGEVVYIDLPEVGDTLEEKNEFGSVESVKTVSGLYAPVSGEVMAVNSELVDQPELLNKSAEEMGWLIKIKVNSPDSLGELMTEAGYKDYLNTL